MIDAPRRWLSPGGEAMPWFRKESGVYERVSWESLPQLAPGDGSFSWLPPLTPPIKGMKSGMWETKGEANVRAYLARIDRQARAIGSALPPDFIRFMTTPSLFERVPSNSGCYYDLRGDADESAALVTVPQNPGNARLLCFMSELANSWYLVLDGAETPLVAMGWHDPRDDWRLADFHVCGESFETFIRRFWMENMLWYRHSQGEPIEGELRAYLDEAKAKHRS